jgi:hypothetical protein
MEVNDQRQGPGGLLKERTPACVRTFWRRQKYLSLTEIPITDRLVNILKGTKN